MILRKPYAFLIKYFKLIHLILCASIAFLTYQANFLLDFFKDYIGGNIKEVIASEYINSSIYVFASIIIVLSIVIYFLMKYKQKPRFLYITNVIVIILSMVCFTYLYGNIKTLEIGSLEAKVIRLLRDISRFNFWALFIILLPSLVRALGFDIKKFNFSKDLEGLKLEAKDSEEVEVNLDLGSDRIKRGGRAWLRELKYYYIENKFFINIILGVIIIILIMIFPFNKFVVHRTKNQGELITTKNFNFKINDSYLSEKQRTSKNNEYLIVKFSVKGKYKKYSLKTDSFVLKVDDKEYIPSLKYYLYFTDVGKGYQRQELNTENYTDYLLIYNISSPKPDSKYTIEYILEDEKIKLSPKSLD